MKTSLKNQLGFTLIEVMVSIFMVASVLLGLAGMTSILIRNNSMNYFTDTATVLAQDKLEELKNAIPTSTILTDVNTTNNSDLENTSNFDYQQSNIDGLGRPGGIYTRTWNIADNSPTAGVKSVVVIVSWTDQAGSHRVSLRTIL